MPAFASFRACSGDGTIGHYAGQWQRFAKWMAEHHADSPALRSVTPEIAAAYTVDLAGACSSSTFNKHVALLTLVFRVLAKPAMMTSNPFAEVRRKRAVQHGRRELTIEELRRVCTEATGELRTLLALWKCFYATWAWRTSTARRRPAHSRMDARLESCGLPLLESMR